MYRISPGLLSLFASLLSSFGMNFLLFWRRESVDVPSRVRLLSVYFSIRLVYLLVDRGILRFIHLGELLRIVRPEFIIIISSAIDCIDCLGNLLNRNLISESLCESLADFGENILVEYDPSVGCMLLCIRVSWVVGMLCLFVLWLFPNQSIKSAVWVEKFRNSAFWVFCRVIARLRSPFPNLVVVVLFLIHLRFLRKTGLFPHGSGSLLSLSLLLVFFSEEIAAFSFQIFFEWNGKGFSVTCLDFSGSHLYVFLGMFIECPNS